MPDHKLPSISSQPLFTAKLFEVDELHITYPTGRQVIHHLVKRQPTVAVFPITPKGEVYLVKQYRYMLKKTTLEAMAGFVDAGETPLQAAKRELKEETGIQAGSWEEIMKMDMAASVVDATVHLFLARDLEIGAAAPEEDEDIEVIKTSLIEALQKVMGGEITTSATITGLLLLDKLLKK